jgi:hypothetical protein
MSREEKLWMFWFLTTIAGFTVLEARAIMRKDTKGTLTYATRKALGIDPVKPWRLLSVAAICSISGWFAAHMVTGEFVPSVMRTDLDAQ